MHHINRENPQPHIKNIHILLDDKNADYCLQIYNNHRFSKAANIQ